VVLPAGTHRLGPASATLSVHTKRTGAAAKAGHNLELAVTAWEGTIEVGAETAMTLTADSSSLRVRSGAGDHLTVAGDVALGDRSQPVTFDLVAGDDGALKATAVVTQSGWGMKPYSILFGSLKVVDEVEIVLEGRLD
jgi:hypothetical protein